VSEYINIQVSHLVAEIALNRPEKRNALNDQAIGELASALIRLDSDPSVRAIVLHGEGTSFCAGYDLAHDSEPIAGVDNWRRQFAFENRMFWALWESRLPVIAAVQGHAIGLGCDLAAVATITLAERSARFSMPEVRFEMAPSFVVLPWLAGGKRSAEFMLTGDSVPADEAVGLGIVTRVVDDGEALSEARTLARKLVKLPPEGLAIAKAQWRGALEAQGIRTGIAHATELAALSAVHESEEARQFKTIIAEQGLRAAFAWRDAQFERSGS
jgi:enoyl-CoA hydratase/carnithine racemase